LTASLDADIVHLPRHIAASYSGNTASATRRLVMGVMRHSTVSDCAAAAAAANEMNTSNSFDMRFHAASHTESFSIIRSSCERDSSAEARQLRHQIVAV